MGRKAIHVDKSQLEATIAECEAKSEYRNQSHLFKDVANILTTRLGLAKVPSAAFVYTQVQKFSLPLKTPKGRKGIQPGERLGGQGERKSRQERLSEHPKGKQALGELKTDILREKNGKFLPIFKRFEKGSLKAALQLKCLDCANYQPNEIRHCPCTGCPLFLVRPYQSATEAEVETE
jgi:hypothetical protein